MYIYIICRVHRRSEQKLGLTPPVRTVFLGVLFSFVPILSGDLSAL